MAEKTKIEASGKITELIQKEKNFAMILDGSPTKFYVYGKIPENLNVGQDISFNYVENVVGEFTYKNVQEIHPEGFVPEDEKVEVVKIGEKQGTTNVSNKVYFVDKFKDIKIVRQNTLRTSVMALDVLHKINSDAANTFIGEAGGIENAIKNLARKFEDEVFRD